MLIYIVYSCLNILCPCCSMLTEKLNMHNVEKYLAVIAANSGKGIYLDDGMLVGKLLPAIDSGLGQTQKLNARLSI